MEIYSLDILLLDVRSPNVISCSMRARKPPSVVKISYFSLSLSLQLLAVSRADPSILLPCPSLRFPSFPCSALLCSARFSVFPPLNTLERDQVRGRTKPNNKLSEERMLPDQGSGTAGVCYIIIFTADCYSRLHIPANGPWIIPIRGKFRVRSWRSGLVHAKQIFCFFGMVVSTAKQVKASE